jgi:uncharacterized protein DUF4386
VPPRRKSIDADRTRDLRHQARNRRLNMTAVISPAIDLAPRAMQRAPSIQAYARAAGTLMVLSLVFGYLGEWYIPSRFMLADPATTAQTITASETLYRVGFAAYLVEAACDIGLALLFYVLLGPVNGPLALASAFFGLVSTALYGVAEMFYFAPTLLLSGASFMKAFTPDQVNALVTLSLRMFARAGMIFLGLYGAATFIRGYLIARSRYLPKPIGLLVMLAGAGFIGKNLTFVLAPAYSSNLFIAPMFFAGLALMGWLLVKGVDVRQWETRAAEGRGV